MDRDPVRTHVRKVERGFGPGDFCIFCGETDPHVLIRKPQQWFIEQGVSAAFFERHHPLGRNHDSELKVVACLNCHKKAHERLLQSGVELRPEPNPRKRAKYMLLAMAVLFEGLSQSVRKMSDWL